MLQWCRRGSASQSEGRGKLDQLCPLSSADISGGGAPAATTPPPGAATQSGSEYATAAPQLPLHHQAGRLGLQPGVERATDKPPYSITCP